MNQSPPTTLSKKELAAAYLISVRTLMRKIKAHKIKAPGKIIYPATLERIYAALGNPFLTAKSGQNLPKAANN